MGRYIKWNLDRLVKAICSRLSNRFDVFLVVEGKRGLGKSTLAFHLMKRVRNEMKKRKIEGYRFLPKRDILYTRNEVLKFFHKRKSSGMADEMINVSFNRDFYNEDQKDLIKMINMNRDHNNFFIACVPMFKNLDSQIKSLVSMKITVVRRGVGIIHRPNNTIYTSDIWDEKYNERIERKWLEKNLANPQYSKLTTYRGYLRFPPLRPTTEELYQKIKDEKRNIIAQEKGLEKQEEEKAKDPFEIIFNQVVERKVKNGATLDGMCQVYGLSPDSIKAKIRKRLQKESKPSSLSVYYFDPKEHEQMSEIDKIFS